MKNFTQPGKILDYFNAGSAILSGAVVVLSGVGCGIAATKIASGDFGPVEVEGVVEVPSTGVINQLARVYWNGTAATATATGNAFMGYAFSSAASSKVKVKLTADLTREPFNALLVKLDNDPDIGATDWLSTLGI